MYIINTEHGDVLTDKKTYIKLYANQRGFNKIKYTKDDDREYSRCNSNILHETILWDGRNEYNMLVTAAEENSLDNEVDKIMGCIRAAMTDSSLKKHLSEKEYKALMYLCKNAVTLTKNKNTMVKQEAMVNTMALFYHLFKHTFKKGE